MYQLPYPAREFVVSQELERLERSNQELIESSYRDDVAIFRADIVAEMASYGASYAEHAWLVYQSEMSRDEEGDVMTRDGEQLRQILIMMRRFNLPATEVSPISIRILSLLKHEIGDGIAFVTEDVMVDEEGDSQLFIDVIFSDEPPPIYPGVPELSNSPLFMIREDSGLILRNFSSFPPVITVEPIEPVGGETPVEPAIPFGVYERPSDRDYALQRARDLLAEARTLDVVAHSLPIVDN